MNGWWVEAVGALAGTLTTLAFIPQVVKVWRARRADDLSLPTFAAFATGVMLWLAYGVMIGAPSIVVANLITFILAGALVAMKMHFSRSPREPGNS